MVSFFRIIFIFFLGSSVASFLWMWMETAGENISRKHSNCDECGRNLGLYELMPVLSILILKFKSKCCGKKLDWKYFVGEVLLGLWFVGSYLYFDITMVGVMSLILGIIFFILVMEDLGEMQVSSKTLYLLVAFSIFSILIKSYFALGLLIKGPGEALGDVIWALIIFSPFWLIYFLGKYLDKPMIGEADSYVFSALGIFFGIQFSISLFLYSVWVGAFLGIAYLIFINKKFERNARIPFLPIIFLACLIILVFNYHVIRIQDILFLYESFYLD